MSDPNKHHNDGEQDRSEGKDYSPPHHPRARGVES